MLEAWIDWGRGPLFRAALVLAALGLLRHAVLTVWEMIRIMHRAGDKTIPWKPVIAATLRWLLPAGNMKNRLFFSLTTFVFHAAVLVTPVFLAGHVALWKRGTGLSWPALPNGTADLLTLAAVAASVLLVLQRAGARDSRALSRPQDYAIPLLVAVPFATGFLIMHPAWNPFPYEAALLAHVLSADLLLLLIPFTKLSHMILLPFTQLISEMAWHFPPHSGSEVAAVLGKEKEPI